MKLRKACHDERLTWTAVRPGGNRDEKPRSLFDGPWSTHLVDVWATTLERVGQHVSFDILLIIAIAGRCWMGDSGAASFTRVAKRMVTGVASANVLTINSEHRW